MFDGPENEEKDINKTMEYLILNGALQVSGIDSETGEFLYSFTHKIKNVMPDLYHEHMNFINSELMGLWEDGFVLIDFLSDDPTITLTEKALDSTEISKLSPQRQWSLEEIKRSMLRKEL